MNKAYASATPEDYFVPFFLLFLVLFAATGVGNGSTFRTIAVVFDQEQAGPVLGWTSAVAAYGAFIIPIEFGDQIKAATPHYALMAHGSSHRKRMVEGPQLCHRMKPVQPEIIRGKDFIAVKTIE